MPAAKRSTPNVQRPTLNGAIANRFFRVILVGSAMVATSLSAMAEVGKWVEQLGATDRDQRRDASYHLMQMGAAARPALPDLIRALDDQDRQVWANAVSAIANIGPEAVEAVPKLLEGMDRSRSRSFRGRDNSQKLFRCAYALSRIGDAAKPQLLEALKAEDAGMRLGAAKALGGMGAKAKDAIPALLVNLGDGDADVRLETADALGLIGTDAVAPLGEALGSKEARVRESSARALAYVGKAAAPAGGKLVELAEKESDSPARVAMIAALPKVGLPHEKIVPPLISALKSDDESLRRAAINSILLVRPAGKTAVPALSSLLGEPAHAERAAYVLGRFGTEAKSTVPALLSAALKTQPPAPAYVEALAQIGAPAVPSLLAQFEKVPVANINRDHWVIQTLKGVGTAALPELQKALASKNASVRLAALGTLNELGPDAREARADILKLAGDPEPLVRATVLSASVSLDSSARQALEKIEAGARDPHPSVRTAAAVAAAALGTEASPIAPQIIKLIDDPDASVRSAALKSVSGFGGNNPELVEKLLGRLDDATTRLAVIEALGKMKSEAALPRLVALYPNADKPTRLAILTALGAGGDSGLPTLEAALKDADAAIRAAAMRGLAKAQRNTDTLVNTIAGTLGDADPLVRHAAAEALAQLGERQSDRAVPALPALVGLVANDSDRAVALESLRSLRVRDVGVITIALDSPSPDARTWACERAGRLGRQGQPLRPKLEAMMNSGNDYERRAARRALEQIGR